MPLALPGDEGKLPFPGSPAALLALLAEEEAIAEGGVASDSWAAADVLA